jgi:hypothetical protein
MVRWFLESYLEDKAAVLQGIWNKKINVPGSL